MKPKARKNQKNARAKVAITNAQAQAIDSLVQALAKKAEAGQQAINTCQAYALACSKLTDALAEIIRAAGLVLDDAEALQRSSSSSIDPHIAATLETACLKAVAYCPTAITTGPETRFSEDARKALQGPVEART